MRNPLAIGIVAFALVAMTGAFVYTVIRLQSGASPTPTGGMESTAAIPVAIVFGAFYVVYSNFVINWLRERLTLRFRVQLLQRRARSAAATASLFAVR